MEFTIKSGSPEKQRSACVVVGVFDNRKPSLSAELIDRASGGYISEIIRRGDMEGKLGSTLLLHNVRGTLADRVLLVGLGKERDFREREFRSAIRAAVRLLNETGSYEAVVYLTEEKVKRREVAWRVEHAVVVAMEAVYRFDQMKSQPADVRRPLRKLTLSVPQRSDLTAGEAAAARGLAIAHGMDLARDLGNLPGQHLHAGHLAERAQALAQELGFKCEVLDRAQARRAENGLVPVGDQRQRPAAEVHRARIPRRAEKAEAAGAGRQGHHVRQRRHLAQARHRHGSDEVRHVRAPPAFWARSAPSPSSRPRSTWSAWSPTCENMPNGRATKPGDVVTQHVGADDRGAQYRRRRPPDPLRRADLRRALRAGGGRRHRDPDRRDGRRARPRRLRRVQQQRQPRRARCSMPAKTRSTAAGSCRCGTTTRRALNSNFADFANIGGRAGGSITAACFLSKFAKKFDWAHLDIAGVAWKEGKEKGATGRPVPLLTTWVLSQEAAP